MRICLLCYRGNPYSGGQGIYLKYVAEELLDQGHEVHVIVGPPYPPLKKGIVVHTIPNNEYYVKKGFSIVNPDRPFDTLEPINFYEFFSTRFGVFPEIRSFSLRAYAKLRTLAGRVSFDIIHDNQCLGYGLLLMKSLGVPVVATIHHPLSIDRENVLERASSYLNKIKAVMFYPLMMQKIVSKRLDHIITVSEDSRRRIHSDFGVPLEKQTVVYNGLDRGIFRPLPGIRRKKGKVLFVGNVEDGKKGFVYLVKAMKHVTGDFRLTVVDGGSPHRKITTQLIRRLGLGDRIEFTGKTPTADLVRHYGESEIVVVPSVYEGFGFPAAEAMACGTPVIACDGGALPEVVGDSGIVVPARDPLALAGALEELLASPAKRRRFGEMGRERVRTHFTWKKAVAQMIDVYRNFAR